MSSLTSPSLSFLRRVLDADRTAFNAKSLSPLTSVAWTLSYPFQLSTPPCA
jgi:hypothetical protein